MALDGAHVFIITVGGNDVSDHLIHKTVKILKALSHEITTADFVVEDTDGTLPAITEWDEVIITDEGATRLFAGYCTRFKAEIAKSMATQSLHLYAQDYTVLLKTVIVNKAYQEQTDEAILDDLFSTYLAEITTTNVTSSGTYSFAFTNITLFEAIQQIAERSEYEWYVDFSKDLHYFREGHPTAAAYDLSNAPDYASTFPWQKGSLTFTRDGEDIINRVTVYGGTTASDVQTEQFSGDGTTAEFYLAHQPVRAMLSVTIDGTQQTWATDFVVYTFTDVDCLVNYHRGRVRWDAASPPAVGVNNIVVKYTYDTQVSVTRNDAVSQAKYGRVFEDVVVRRDISNVTEAEELGDAILAQKANRQSMGRVVVEKYGLLPGQMLSITSSALDFDEDRGYGIGGYGEGGYGGDAFLIQSVTTRYSRGGVEHVLALADYQPTLADILNSIMRGNDTAGIAVAEGADYNVGELIRAPLGDNDLYVGRGIAPDRTTAYYNVVVGDMAAHSGTSFSENAIIGYKAAYDLDTGYKNVVIGTEAGYGLTGGADNVVIGYRAGYSADFDDGSQNVLIGEYAGYSMDNASNNVFIGTNAGRDNTTGQFNTFVGDTAGQDNTTADINTYIGMEAGEHNETGTGNAYLGYAAGQSAGNENYCTYIGTYAGAGLYGNYNAALGYNAGASGSTGIRNVLLGAYAGYQVDGGDYNVAIGYEAGKGINANDYDNNTLIGYQAGLSVTTGGDNVKLGYQAGFSGTTQAGCVMLGYQAGYNEVGNNKLYIENSNSATPLICGEFDNDLVRFNAASALTNSIHDLLFLQHITSGTAAAGFGTGIKFELEDAGGTAQVASEDVTLWAVATAGSEMPLRRWTNHPAGVAGPGYGGYITANDVDDNAVTIIPNGGGDVTAVLSVLYAVSESAGGTSGGATTVDNNATVSLYDDAVDVLDLIVAADGSVTLIRSAGAATFDVALQMCWI